MSDSLDKLFRDRQSNVPPASPPDGQWERIQRRQMVVGTGDKRRPPFGVLLLGLLLGLGMGVPTGAFYFVAECPAYTEIEQTHSDPEMGKRRGGGRC